jgi:hypothetical protein
MESEFRSFALINVKCWLIVLIFPFDSMQETPPHPDKELSPDVWFGAVAFFPLQSSFIYLVLFTFLR